MISPSMPMILGKSNALDAFKVYKTEGEHQVEKIMILKFDEFVTSFGFKESIVD